MFLAVLNIIDGVSDSWIKRAGILIPKRRKLEGALGCAVSQNRAYLMGGKPSLCASYNPDTNTWVKLQAPQAEHINGRAVALKNNKILFFGRDSQSRVSVYSLETGEWSTIEMLNSSSLELHFAFKVIKYTVLS